MKPKGRRPGENQTRRIILDTARRKFSEDGYEGTSVRSIARAAEVDAALVLHFFGSKERLFTEATQWPFSTEAAVTAILAGPRSGVGLRLARFSLSVWEHPERREPIMGMLRAATTSDHAAGLLRETLREHILGPVAAGLDIEDADLRMSLCGAQIVGLGVARYVVRLEPLASQSVEDVAELVAPVFQRYMVGRL